MIELTISLLKNKSESRRLYEKVLKKLNDTGEVLLSANTTTVKKKKTTEIYVQLVLTRK